jgi:hypothetical protein
MGSCHNAASDGLAGAWLTCSIPRAEVRFSRMGWATPQYDRKEVNAAGDRLVADTPLVALMRRDEVLAVIQNDLSEACPNRPRCPRLFGSTDS